MNVLIDSIIRSFYQPTNLKGKYYFCYSLMVICNSEPNRWSAWFLVRTLGALNLSTLWPSETQLRMFWPVEGRHGQTPFRLQNPAWHLLPGVSVVFGPCPWSLWWSELGHLWGLVTFVKLGNELNPENSTLSLNIDCHDTKPFNSWNVNALSFLFP